MATLLPLLRSKLSTHSWHGWFADSLLLQFKYPPAPTATATEAAAGVLESNDQVLVFSGSARERYLVASASLGLVFDGRLCRLIWLVLFVD